MKRLAKLLMPLILIIMTAMISRQCKTGSGNEHGDYDLVIINGRVMDPESGLDAVRNIGIKEGTVRVITERNISGRDTINATGLVVAPGFIDIHQHGQDDENYRYKVLDGVTTALELEMGTADVERWYSERKDKAIINHE